mmetsp:Transcript_6746/g.16098  ORF Transcript_6746/g.16098 Transcript_6746/m.16098 type:complete len:259 (-) Transcript_6746:847-1623(-)
MERPAGCKVMRYLGLMARGNHEGTAFAPSPRSDGKLPQMMLTKSFLVVGGAGSTPGADQVDFGVGLLGTEAGDRCGMISFSATVVLLGFWVSPVFSRTFGPADLRNMTRLAFVLLFCGDTSLFFDVSIESSLETIMSVLQTNKIGEHITRGVSVNGTPAIAVFAAKVTTLAKQKLSLGRDTCGRNKIMHRHSFLPSYLGVLWWLIIASADIKLARQCLGLVETTRNANFVKADVKLRLSVAAVICGFDREYVLVLVPR